MSGERQAELKEILEARSREIEQSLRDRVTRARHLATSAEVSDVVDTAESAEVDMQEDLDFALLQLKSETLAKTQDALRRLESGTFGICASCGDEIAEKRLRALPFAMRCTECEEMRETAVNVARSAQRRFPGSMLETQ